MSDNQIIKEFGPLGPGDNQILMDHGAQVIGLIARDGLVYIAAICLEGGAVQRPRRFYGAYTGQIIPPIPLKYIGGVDAGAGYTSRHFFEVQQ